MDEAHSTHCSFCISASCNFSLCPLIECPLCYGLMHECKREDHREICRMEMVPCLNAGSGCPLTVRRSLMSRHLVVCPASVISCSHERARAARDKPAKKALKSLGKTRREKDFECPPSTAEIPIDEALAFYDQRLIIEGYTYSRVDRTRRRDLINIREPQLPLRPIVDGGTSEEGGLRESRPAPSQDEAVDSSDDERKIEEARIKKLRGIFADCYMCQVDPCVQHFHTSDARWDLLMYQRTRRTYYQMDPFYAERNLMVTLHVEKAHRSGSVYTRRCLAAVRRNEHDAHHTSQHVTAGDMDLESLLVRCPLWWRGCTFTSARIRPAGGEIRFIQELGAFTLRPTLSFTSPILDDSSPLLEAPDWALVHISQFLSGVSLAALASTCKYMRDTLFTSSVALHRGVVSLRWSKTDSRQWTSSPFWSFPLSEQSPLFHPSSSPDLSLHIARCPCNEPCPLPDFARAEPGPVNGAVPCLPDTVREAAYYAMWRKEKVGEDG